MEQCTAEMAAKCTSEMAAASTAHGTAATAAAMAQCSAEMAAACKAKGASARMDHCAMKGAKATSAAAEGCPMSGAGVTADAKSCSAHGASAVTADSKACPHGAASAATAGTSCSMKGAKNTAAAIGHEGKSSCNGEGMANVAGRNAHADCDACGDMVKCADEISAAGGHAEMVPLKNGVMWVYTAESAEGIRAIKAAVSERNARLASYTGDDAKSHLCSQCKAMRGAAASGKLTREVVSIEGGCLTLMTSTDPAIVAQLHAMTGMTVTRTKS